MHALEAELAELKKALPGGRVAPLPGETADSSASQLGSTSKTVGSSMAQLLTAAAQVSPLITCSVHLCEAVQFPVSCCTR